MDDTISRQAAIDAVDIKNLHRGIVDALQNILSELPSAQPTGRWIYVEEEYCWCCSSCKTMMAEWEAKPVWNYCPNCGAKMEEAER